MEFNMKTFREQILGEAKEEKSTWHVISKEGNSLAILASEEDAELFREKAAFGYYNYKRLIMKTFRDIVQEGLTYSVNKEQLDSIKDISGYEISKDGKTDLYKKDGEDIFKYDNKKEKLTVIKNGWQLMNLHRGY
jgi:hypothetical protein